MLRPLLSTLPALLLAMLAGCESAHFGGVADGRDAAPSVAREAPRRCMHCGWIESKREVRPGDARTPAIYEYTVRMRDGSGGVFREEHPSSWRLGERLIFIAGAGAAG